ncbi:hypothetical protein [Paramagnetospirillum caucaseum]|uniref:hypothetical protein n=1 Tax=Paramagnetospirillum caucaseum TaxID=1244869 RepID=UPI0003479852|nr:hypothetical protein [Paramagnetospirillum caucaseum]
MSNRNPHHLWRPILRVLLLLAADAVWRVGDVAGWICTKAYRQAGRMRARALFPGRTA